MVKDCNIDVEQRGRMAEELFESGGYNCCQAVVLAFKDMLPFDESTAAALCSGFGGGFGRMREVCGAVSGMTMMTGVMSPADNPADKAARTANYALVQKLAGQFKEEKGSIVCRELLGLRMENSSPVPSDRTAQYYHSRPCTANVGLAARLVAMEIKNQKQNNPRREVRRGLECGAGRS